MMKYEFEPVGARVVIKRDAAEEVSPGGIVLPDSTQEKPRFGTVIAVGPGVRNTEGNYWPLQVQKNDYVLISPYAETVKMGEEELVIAREEDILAIVKGGSKKYPV